LADKGNQKKRGGGCGDEKNHLSGEERKGGNLYQYKGLTEIEKKRDFSVQGQNFRGFLGRKQFVGKKKRVGTIEINRRGGC